MPRRIVDIFGDALALLERRHFFELFHRLGKLFVALVELLDALCDLHVLAVDEEQEVHDEEMQHEDDEVFEGVGDEHVQRDGLIAQHLRNGEHRKIQDGAANAHRDVARELFLAQIELRKDDDKERRDEPSARKIGEHEQKKDIDDITDDAALKRAQRKQFDGIFRRQCRRNGQDDEERGDPFHFRVAAVHRKDDLGKHERKKDEHLADRRHPLEGDRIAFETFF